MQQKRNVGNPSNISLMNDQAQLKKQQEDRQGYQQTQQIVKNIQEDQNRDMYKSISSNAQSTANSFIQNSSSSNNSIVPVNNISSVTAPNLPSLNNVNQQVNDGKNQIPSNIQQNLHNQQPSTNQTIQGGNIYYHSQTQPNGGVYQQGQQTYYNMNQVPAQPPVQQETYPNPPYQQDYWNAHNPVHAQNYQVHQHQQMINQQQQIQPNQVIYDQYSKPYTYPPAHIPMQPNYPNPSQPPPYIQPQYAQYGYQNHAYPYQGQISQPPHQNIYYQPPSNDPQLRLPQPHPNMYMHPPQQYQAPLYDQYGYPIPQQQQQQQYQQNPQMQNQPYNYYQYETQNIPPNQNQPIHLAQQTQQNNINFREGQIQNQASNNNNNKNNISNNNPAPFYQQDNNKNNQSGHLSQPSNQGSNTNLNNLNEANNANLKNEQQYNEENSLHISRQSKKGHSSYHQNQNNSSNNLSSKNNQKSKDNQQNSREYNNQSQSQKHPDRKQNSRERDRNYKSNDKISSKNDFPQNSTHRHHHKDKRNGSISKRTKQNRAPNKYNQFSSKSKSKSRSQSSSYSRNQRQQDGNGKRKYSRSGSYYSSDSSNSNKQIKNQQSKHNKKDQFNKKQGNAKSSKQHSGEINDLSSMPIDKIYHSKPQNSSSNNFPENPQKRKILYYDSGSIVTNQAKINLSENYDTLDAQKKGDPLIIHKKQVKTLSLIRNKTQEVKKVSIKPSLNYESPQKDSYEDDSKNKLDNISIEFKQRKEAPRLRIDKLSVFNTPTDEPTQDDSTNYQSKKSIPYHHHHHHIQNNYHSQQPVSARLFDLPIRESPLKSITPEKISKVEYQIEFNSINETAQRNPKILSESLRKLQNSQMFFYTILGKDKRGYTQTTNLQTKITKIQEEKDEQQLQNEQQQQETQKTEQVGLGEFNQGGGMNQNRYFCDKKGQICFKCGKSGHVRNACMSQEEQVCTFCLGKHMMGKCDQKVCFKCGEIGHERTQCQVMNSNDNQPIQNMYARKRIPKCNHCTKLGHIQYNCGIIKPIFDANQQLRFQNYCDGNDIPALACLKCGQFGHTNCFSFYQNADSLYSAEELPNQLKYSIFNTVYQNELERKDNQIDDQRISADQSKSPPINEQEQNQYSYQNSAYTNINQNNLFDEQSILLQQQIYGNNENQQQIIGVNRQQIVSENEQQINKSPNEDNQIRQSLETSVEEIVVDETIEYIQNPIQDQQQQLHQLQQQAIVNQNSSQNKAISIESDTF